MKKRHPSWEGVGELLRDCFLFSIVFTHGGGGGGGGGSRGGVVKETQSLCGPQSLKYLLSSPSERSLPTSARRFNNTMFGFFCGVFSPTIHFQGFQMGGITSISTS